MMKQGYNIILYSLIGLLLIAGILLFLFHVQIFNYLRGQMDLGEPLATSTVVVSAHETLDTTILKTPRFTALNNYVVNFDFDTICWRPDATPNRLIARSPETIATGTEIATGTAETVQTLDCQAGNDLPFLVKTK